jgi:hypothetical protein
MTGAVPLFPLLLDPIYMRFRLNRLEIILGLPEPGDELLAQGHIVTSYKASVFIYTAVRASALSN